MNRVKVVLGLAGCFAVSNVGLSGGLALLYNPFATKYRLKK